MALRRRERRALGNDDAEARHALNAFVGGRDGKVDADLREVDVDGGKRAHAVDDERAAARLDDPADRRNVVQNARRRLVVHHRDDSDFGMSIQIGRDLGGIVALGERAVHAVDRRLLQRQDLHHALGIDAVHEHEHMIVRTRHGREHRLDAVRAGALHEDRFVFGRIGMRNLEDALPDVFDDRLEFIVPGEALVQHLLAHVERCRERPRRQHLEVVRIADVRKSGRPVRFDLGLRHVVLSPRPNAAEDAWAPQAGSRSLAGGAALVAAPSCPGPARRRLSAACASFIQGSERG